MKNYKQLALILAALSLMATGCAKAPTEDTPNEVMQEVKHEVKDASEGNEQASEPTPTNWTLDDMDDDQLVVFEIALGDWRERIVSGEVTIEEADQQQSQLLDTLLSDIASTPIPDNIQALFKEWKQSTGYYDNLTPTNTPVDVEPEEQQQPVQQQQQPSQSTNKPQPSTNQQQQQQQQSSEDDYSHLPTPEEARETIISAGGTGDGTRVIFDPADWGYPET